MSEPEVFIIESLKFEEEENYREGDMICRSLRMSGKKPLYHYVRTTAELEHFIGEFEKSNYRYLHISCHGSKSGISTTLEDLTTDDFAEIVGPSLEKRRLFLSTCRASTPVMAKAVFAQSNCYSIAGPVNSIHFDDSVVLWTSFYHLMFKANDRAMKLDRLKRTLAKSAVLVGEDINLYTRSNGKVVHTQVPGRIRKKKGV